MNTAYSLPRWIAFASFAAITVLASTGARAFTDSNAELKAAAADKADRVVVAGKATRPVPTVWVPHSYAACSQHAPDEHLLAPVAREGLRLMTGVFWDLGAQGRPA